MQNMIDEALFFSHLTTIGAIQIRSKAAGQVIFKLYDQLSVELLKLVVEYHFRIKPEDQLLKHLGVEICVGLLCDYGIGPGSAVFLHRI